LAGNRKRKKKEERKKVEITNYKAPHCATSSILLLLHPF
jgi:hypothetical protein